MKAPVKQVVAVVTREITVRSAENILNLIETDQTAPAGRWRLRLDGDKIYFDRATAADWATFETWLTYDKANEKLTLGKKLDASALKIENLGAPAAQDDALRYNRPEIRNAEIAEAAKIVYTKLLLTGKIKAADIETGAGIPLTKLEAAVCSILEAAGLITDHSGAADPHGDRAYTNTHEAKSKNIHGVGESPVCSETEAGTIADEKKKKAMALAMALGVEVG